MSKTRFECRQVILKHWTQMTPGSETLTYLDGNTRVNGKYPCPTPLGYQKIKECLVFCSV